MHAEDIRSLDTSVAVASELVEECYAAAQAGIDGADQGHKAMQNYCSYAKMHRDLIARFGRYPHRNQVLERESSPEEIEYLRDGERFGQ